MTLKQSTINFFRLNIMILNFCVIKPCQEVIDTRVR